MFIEGTRLKAVYQEVEGAPPYFLNWYDTKLGVDCTFVARGPSDQLICLPSDAVQSSRLTTYAYGSGFFSDSSCQEPLVDVGQSCQRRRFFARWPSDGAPCGTTVQLFSLGDAVADEPGSLHEVDSVGGEGCRAHLHPNVWESHGELHRLGPEIPLDALVSGTYRHEPGPGRIVPVSIVGSDGSVQNGGAIGTLDGGRGHSVAWDSERKTLVSTALLHGRWYPAATAFGGESFSDAACSTPVAVGSSCDGVLHEGLSYDTDGELELFELKPRVETPTYYLGSDTGCYQDDRSLWSPRTNPRLAAFGVGAPVPASAFAVESDILTGTGQVQLAREGTSDGPPGSGIGFFDTALGQACSLPVGGAAADGVTRCLPPADPLPSPPSSALFADAACSIPIVFRSRTVDARQPHSDFWYSDSFEGTVDACFGTSYRRHMHLPKEPYAGPIFIGAGRDFCGHFGSTADPPQRDAFLLGAEVPPSQFVEVRYVRPTDW